MHAQAGVDADRRQEPGDALRQRDRFVGETRRQVDVEFKTG